MFLTFHLLTFRTTGYQHFYYDRDPNTFHEPVFLCSEVTAPALKQIRIIVHNESGFVNVPMYDPSSLTLQSEK